VLNYLPYEVEFSQKCSNKSEDVNHNWYKVGACKEADNPNGCAFTFNPLVDKDKCDIDFRIIISEPN
jgi:hypothetical protein